MTQATLLHGIGPDTRALLDEGGSPVLTTWGDFARDNGDALDLPAIAAALLKRPGCTFEDGGGAAARWSIRLLVDDMTAFETWRSTGQDVECLADHDIPEVEAPGRLYDGGAWIEKVDDENAATIGRWYLLIENCQWSGNDLGALEWLLWERHVRAFGGAS